MKFKELHHELWVSGLRASQKSPEQIRELWGLYISKLEEAVEALDAVRRSIDWARAQPDPSVYFTPEVLAALEEDDRDNRARFAFLNEEIGILQEWGIVLTAGQHSAEQCEDAVKNIAKRIGKASGPFAPEARAALKKAARLRGKYWRKLLDEEVIPAAIWSVAQRAIEPEELKVGYAYVTDSEGKIVPARAAVEFGAGSESFLTWVARQVQKEAEAQIREMAREQPAPRNHAAYVEDKQKKIAIASAIPRGFHKPIVMDEIAGLDGIPDPIMGGVYDLFTPEELELIRRHEDEGGLGPRERKQFERLRLRVADAFRKLS
jgi:hypothetical protein